MKKAAKFTVMAAGALALTSMFGLSAMADHRDDGWRDSRRDSRHERRDSRYERRGDRDFLRGEVERVDRRRGVVVLRTHHSGRPVLVEMVRRSGRGIDVEDLRRGDYVTFVGDWSRGGVFTAWRIDDVDSGRRNRHRDRDRDRDRRW